MGFYKNIFNKKIVIAGRSKGASPSYLMPPDGTNAKQGYQIYSAVDLLCEGEIAGLVSQEGKILNGGNDSNPRHSVKKDFNSENNKFGGNTLSIDQGVYFNDTPLRDVDGNSTHSKYLIQLRTGKILQGRSFVMPHPERLMKVSAPIKGPYSMAQVMETRSRTNRYGQTEYYQVDVSRNGARTGSGSRDIRSEGTSDRDFVGWQNYVPIEKAAKPYTYTNYDKDIDQVDIGLQIDSLSDTKSFSTKSENQAGKSKMGTPMPLTITFRVEVGKADKDGNLIMSKAVFVVRPGKGKTIGEGENTLSVRGIITAPYTVTLEGINLPVLQPTDLYNFVKIHKQQHETISNLVNRDGGIATITERYLETFYYPGSCYVASQIDSQYHPQVPARTFRLKGKKIKIPSNYTPTLSNGEDRRFSDRQPTSAQVTSFKVVNDDGGNNSNDGEGNFTPNGTSQGSTKWRDSSNGHEIYKVKNENDVFVWVYTDTDSNPFFVSEFIVGATSSSAEYPWNSSPNWAHFTNGGSNLEGFNELIFSDFGPQQVGTRGNQIYQGDWDGSFKYAWSDNPAWIYYDILTNKRYGLGSYLRDIDIIDKWTLYEIGMYCDAVTMNDGSKTTNEMGGPGKFIGVDDGFGGLEPRFSCNILMKDQTDAFDAIQNLARSFRAMTYFNNSCVSIKVDRPYLFEDFNNTFVLNSAPKENKFPPHLIFNNLNVKDGIFSYADVDRQTKLSAVEVSFLDKRNNFTSQTEYVEDPEAIKTVGLNFKQIEGVGITSKAQAHRLAKYILFESLHTTETISFNAGFEALLIQPGDIIRVEDEMRNFTRNYGTVLGASGVTTYYDPDGTTNLNTLDNGKGPTAIIVEPAIGSDLTDYVTGGNIHLYNPVGKSGIEDFYRNPTSNNELYKEIHNPQVISLKIKPGGLNSSYKIIDSGVAIFVNQTETFVNGVEESQWFSDKDANILHGSIYNIDSSGRNPKYYRVLNISEDKNLGFNVSATIHHTGKFKFVEENISFDLDPGTFQPNLTQTEVVRPNLPTFTTGTNGVAGTSFSAGINKSLNLNLTITDPGTKVPEKYIIILEEPDSTTIVTEVFKSNSTVTNVTLSGDSKIDQIGTYNVSIFSENTTPVIARTTTSVGTSFTTEIDDFTEFNNQDAFTEYSNISIETDFNSDFDNSAETGSAQNSFAESDSTINAIVDLEFEDIFGNVGADVQRTVTEQKINILDSQGVLKQENFKTLANDSSFTIYNEQINEIFGYTGDGKYRVPPGLSFEVGSFTIPANNSSNKIVTFESDFAEVPAVFTQQKVSGSFNDVYRPLGRILTNSNTNNFHVQSLDDSPRKNIHETNYSYVASETGVHLVDSKRLEVNFVNKNNTTGFQEVSFAQNFLSPPIVVIQLQQDGGTASERETSRTCITGVTADKFHFAAYQDNGVAAGGTGKYAYIAIDQAAVNNTTASDMSRQVLNYAATGIQNYSFGDPILNEFNGSEASVTNSRYNHDQYAVLCQNSGTNADLEEKFFVVHETGGQNRLHQQMIISGLRNGIRSSQTNGANNHILLTGTDLTVGTGDFFMFAWAKFETTLDGKQYLLESHKNGTGIAWFQSGDGKNYVNLNGVDHPVSEGASLNDGNVHALYVEVERGVAARGYVDNTLSKTNTQITQHTTGFTVANVGSGMVDNPNSFDGDYTGGGSLYQNTVTSGLRIRKVSNSLGLGSWLLQDEDPANTYSHDKIAWYADLGVIPHPAVVTSTANWNAGDTIQDGTITNSSAPTFSDFLSESFDAQTGFKVLGNSELVGNALTSGHIQKYIGLRTGAFVNNSTRTHHANISTNTFKNAMDHNAKTKFILDVSGEKYFEDISTNNTASGSIVGSIERSQKIIDRSIQGNFNFIQIGVTGTL